MDLEENHPYPKSINFQVQRLRIPIKTAKNAPKSVPPSFLSIPLDHRETRDGRETDRTAFGGELTRRDPLNNTVCESTNTPC